jgi:hypothetical protein
VIHVPRIGLRAGIGVLGRDPYLLSGSSFPDQAGCLRSPVRRHADCPGRISTVISDKVPPGGFGVELPDLVGKSTNEATQLAIEEGIAKNRVLESEGGVTITPMTMDWLPTRLNLTVEGDVVVNAQFG